MKRKPRLHTSFISSANPYPTLPDHLWDKLQLAWQRDNDTDTAKIVIISPFLLPDQVFLDNANRTEESFPAGLRVAAWLGSTLAQGRLKAAALPGPPAREVPESRWDLPVYESYLEGISALFAAPEPEAPAFMKSEAWQRKTLNTGLAGWAQLRHAFVLQAREGASWLLSTPPFPGFVEPVPEFYRRMGEVITKCMAPFIGSGGRNRWVSRRCGACMHCGM